MQLFWYGFSRWEISQTGEKDIQLVDRNIDHMFFIESLPPEERILAIQSLRTKNESVIKFLSGEWNKSFCESQGKYRAATWTSPIALSIKQTSL